LKKPLFGSTAPNAVFVLLLAAATLIVIGRRNELKAPIQFLIFLSTYVILIGFVGLSLYWSPSTQYSVYKFTRMLILIVPMVTIGFIVAGSRSRTQRFLYFVVVFCVLISVIGLYAALSKGTIYALLGTDNRIPIARLSGLGSVLLFHYIIQATSKRANASLVIAFIVCLIALFVSGARAPLIASIGAISVYYSLYSAKRAAKNGVPTVLSRPKSFVVKGTAFVLSLIVITYSGAGYTIDRLSRLWTDTPTSSINGRLEFYNLAYEFWLTKPIIGQGIGSFPILVNGTKEILYPHNIFAEALVELGFIGVLLVTFIIVYSLCILLRKSIQARDFSTLAIFVIILYLFLNALVSADIPGNRLLFIFLAFVGVSDTKNG
jgi:hypothetical protein